jgi:hypothetical protein
MKRRYILFALAVLIFFAASLFVYNETLSSSVIGWGWNIYGQCNAPPGESFTAIAGGDWHSLGLRTDGSLLVWGRNTSDLYNVPAGNNFVKIASGWYHCLALRNNGSIAVWGNNQFGQSNGPSGYNFAGVAGGLFHSVALKTDGSLVAWGRNNLGQCNVPAGNYFVKIACGMHHSLAIKNDGSLAGWGYNNQGQRNVPAGNDYVDIAGGRFHSMALKTDGSLVAWGDNANGQCNVPSGNDFVAVACGQFHSMALKSDGTVLVWGDNTYGQCSVPSGHSFGAIAVGTQWHCLALPGGIQPDVKANGSDGPVITSPLDALSVTIELNANGMTDNADWWVVAVTPFGIFSLASGNVWQPGIIVWDQRSLYDMGPVEILDTSGVPAGTYVVYFGVDTNMDGALTMSSLFYDFVVINVNGTASIENLSVGSVTNPISKNSPVSVQLTKKRNRIHIR